jgi:hypothetical protein
MKEEKIMAKKNETPSTEQAALLATDQVGALATDQAVALTSNQVGALTTAQLGALPAPSTARHDVIAMILPEHQPAVDAAPQCPAASPVVFVLLKNHGLHADGRTCEFFEAGREFDAVKDSALISRLVRSGAELEQR